MELPPGGALSAALSSGAAAARLLGFASPDTVMRVALGSPALLAASQGRANEAYGAHFFGRGLFRAGGERRSLADFSRRAERLRAHERSRQDDACWAGAARLGVAAARRSGVRPELPWRAAHVQRLLELLLTKAPEFEAEHVQAVITPLILASDATITSNDFEQVQGDTWVPQTLAGGLVDAMQQAYSLEGAAEQMFESEGDGGRFLLSMNMVVDGEAHARAFCRALVDAVFGAAAAASAFTPGQAQELRCLVDGTYFTDRVESEGAGLQSAAFFLYGPGRVEPAVGILRCCNREGILQIGDFRGMADAHWSTAEDADVADAPLRGSIFECCSHTMYSTPQRSQAAALLDLFGLTHLSVTQMHLFLVLVAVAGDVQAFLHVLFHIAHRECDGPIQRLEPGLDSEQEILDKMVSALQLKSGTHAAVAA